LRERTADIAPLQMSARWWAPWWRIACFFWNRRIRSSASPKPRYAPSN